MTEVIITAIAGLITTGLGSWASWFFARRKYDSEVDNNIIENMQKSLDFYMRLSDDNKARLDEALKRNEILESEIQQLRTQVFELMTNICYDMACELRKKTPVKKRNNKADKDETCSTKKVQEG